jgi:hypothetical protein
MAIGARLPDVGVVPLVRFPPRRGVTVLVLMMSDVCLTPLGVDDQVRSEPEIPWICPWGGVKQSVLGMDALRSTLLLPVIALALGAVLCFVSRAPRNADAASEASKTGNS